MTEPSINFTFDGRPLRARAGQTLAAASSDFKFASAVAEFGERLRGKRPEGRNAGMILEQAESARGNDPHGLRGEFIELVKKAMSGLHQ